MSDWTPTGRWRHRTEQKPSVFDDGELLVLQVEERGLHTSSICGHIDTEWVSRWRDATIADLTTTTSPTP